MRLIERFYVPSSGRVLLDGRDVGLYDPHWLKRRVALVSQEPVLYARRSIPKPEGLHLLHFSVCTPEVYVSSALAAILFLLAAA